MGGGAGLAKLGEPGSKTPVSSGDFHQKLQQRVSNLPRHL
jgi:hypothetical protein